MTNMSRSLLSLHLTEGITPRPALLWHQGPLHVIRECCGADLGFGIPQSEHFSLEAWRDATGDVKYTT